MPCGIDNSDLEALRADNASFYRQKSAVSDTDRQRALPNTSIMVARMTTRFSAMLIFLSIEYVLMVLLALSIRMNRLLLYTG